MSRAQDDTPVNHSTAAWSPEVQREIKGLQTANRTLAERVVELEELVDQLRHGLEEQGSEDEAVGSGFLEHIRADGLRRSSRRKMTGADLKSSYHRRQETITVLVDRSLYNARITILQEALHLLHSHLPNRMPSTPMNRPRQLSSPIRLLWRTIHATCQLSTSRKPARNSLPIY